MKRLVRATIGLMVAFTIAGCQSHAEFSYGDAHYYSSRDKQDMDVDFDVTKPDGTHVKGTVKASGDSTAANAAMWTAWNEVIKKLPQAPAIPIP